MPGMRAIARAEEINLGFQIAPMIDVVFVIMLFFMVMAGAMKMEREFSTALPSWCPGGVVDPDELYIKIYEGGTITVNEEEMSGSADSDTARLTRMFIDLEREASARGAKVLATIEAEEDARYQRMMDVLNGLSRAKISNVTVMVGFDD